jgi:hypothetical protein
VLKESRIRHAPKLRFVLDESLKRAAEVEAAMRAAGGEHDGDHDGDHDGEQGQQELSEKMDN